MLIRFHPEADKEFHEALVWYSRQRKGLDAEFVMCVDEAIQRISYNPQGYPIVHLHLRKAPVRRFPFLIIYESTKTQIHVIAVFHSRRNPSIWRTRV